MRKFLFLSGEFRVTMPVVFKRDDWQHTMIPRHLTFSEKEGGLRRDNLPQEDLRGFIYFADVEPEGLRQHNLQKLIDSNLPCWPNPTDILKCDDRHQVMKTCISAGLVDNWVYVGRKRDFDPHNHQIEYPCVLKLENLHRGQGKYLIKHPAEFEKEWRIPGMEATVEPFFDGDSWRVLFIGEKYFFLRFDNPNSWIKNSSGADVEEVTDNIPDGLLEHARKVKATFPFEICGIDYIVEKTTKKIRFLEFNMFPGVDASENISSEASRFFLEKMDMIASM